nr:hypothetical protein [Bacillus timonensis]
MAPTPEGIDIESLGPAQLKKFAKAYQALDKAFANIQVYTEYSEAQLGSVYPIQLDQIEEYHGKYVNVLEKLRKEKEDKDNVDVNIEYELESVKTEEINYEYILLLIQAYLQNTHDESEKQPPAEKTVEEINQYLARLKKGNPTLAGLMETLWSNIQANPEAYRDQHVSSLLEQMIQQTINTLVDDFAKTWWVQNDELAFMVANYNPARKKQNGEAELKETSDYEGYKEHTENPVKRLIYWKSVKQAFEEMMIHDILPLQKI